MSKDYLFRVKKHFAETLLNTEKEDSAYTIVNGEVLARVQSVWFTSFRLQDRNPLNLIHKYSPDTYMRYDNYDAIECSNVKDIPYDYNGVIGVPISFLNKYNPDQFEIVDMNPHFITSETKIKQLSLKSYGKRDPYVRILIKRKQN